MLVSYYLPGNMSAPPPALLVYGHSGRTEEEQSLFDPLPYGWSAGGHVHKKSAINIWKLTHCTGIMISTEGQNTYYNAFVHSRSAPPPALQPYLRGSKSDCSSSVQPECPYTRSAGGGADIFPGR